MNRHIRMILIIIVITIIISTLGYFGLNPNMISNNYPNVPKGVVLNILKGITFFKIAILLIYFYLLFAEHKTGRKLTRTYIVLTVLSFDLAFWMMGGFFLYAKIKEAKIIHELETKKYTNEEYDAMIQQIDLRINELENKKNEIISKKENLSEDKEENKE